MNRLLCILLIIVLAPAISAIVITPMDSDKQFVFAIVSLAILFLLNLSKRRDVSIILIIFSILTSTRYLYFRAEQTLIFDSMVEGILGTGLFLAELYSWVMLILGYIQTAFPLNRKIVPLPKDVELWPTVDVYIPTYNESLDVVRDTVLAAQCIEYPKDKIKIYILDDGKRNEFASFAVQAGSVIFPERITHMPKRVTLIMLLNKLVVN